MNDLLKTVYVAAFSVITLFILTKLMGKRQISQLSMFDYINGISIGSIAAEMATAIDTNIFLYVVAMSVYAALALIISVITRKSLRIRKLLEGNSLLLINGDIIYRENFKKAKLDLSEFIALCRIKGFYDISQIQTAILETNGQISILSKAEFEAVKYKDVDINPQKNTLIYNVIMDGKIVDKNMQLSSRIEEKLKDELINSKLTSEDVFLALYNPESDTIKLYEIDNSKSDPVIS